MSLSRACCTPSPRDVAGDAGVLALAADLVDLVDEDDAPLGPLHVVVGHLEQLGEDVLHVLAHVAGFGQGGGVRHGQGHVQDPGQGLGQQGLAGARGADAAGCCSWPAPPRWPPRALLGGEDALVVVVDGHGQALLGGFLADDVVVQEGLDLLGPGQLRVSCLPSGLALAAHAQLQLPGLHALVADEGLGPARSCSTSWGSLPQKEQCWSFLFSDSSGGLRLLEACRS